MTVSGLNAGETAATTLRDECNRAPRSLPRSQHQRAEEAEGKTRPEPKPVGKMRSPAIVRPIATAAGRPIPTITISPSATPASERKAWLGFAPALSEKLR